MQTCKWKHMYAAFTSTCRMSSPASRSCGANLAISLEVCRLDHVGDDATPALHELAREMSARKADRPPAKAGRNQTHGLDPFLMPYLNLVLQELEREMAEEAALERDAAQKEEVARQKEDELHRLEQEQERDYKEYRYAPRRDGTLNPD